MIAVSIMVEKDDYGAVVYLEQTDFEKGAREAVLNEGVVVHVQQRKEGICGVAVWLEMVAR